jgi:hypothetical protein
MDLRSPRKHENADYRHAGMDGRHLGSQGRLPRHPCQLDSSTPCWNDAIENFESYEFYVGYEDVSAVSAAAYGVQPLCVSSVWTRRR